MYTTRIAPSPTGMFHIGTARNAYFNWLAARISGGRFILRIDDTDTSRNSQEAVQVILDSMEWLGLDYDELYFQSARADLHLETAHTLVKAGSARVFDDGAIALNMPDLPDWFMDTIVGKVTISDTAKKAMDPIILVRGTGSPTYQFASIVDDFYMGVNWIIRGQEHLQNTPKQMAIWIKAFTELSNFPLVSHVGLIHRNGKKMSKRDGDTVSLLWYRQQGYHPDAILSFLLRMGWGPRNEDKSHKLITRERALELFLTNGVMRSSPANYDEAKLENLQANYERILGIPHDQWVSIIKKANEGSRTEPVPPGTI